MQAVEVLKRRFGHDAFREGQEALVEALLAGRDALGVMPTGAGKSACYQVPALMLPGLTLVVSPLISLMKDQVAALRQAGVAAAYLNSSLTAAQYGKVLAGAEAGQYKIVYIAPERLETADFLRFAENADISLVAVDEAHCVSQWGQDFRPSYLRIPAFLARLARRPTVGAFTATATAEVKADIMRMLALRDPLLLTTGFDRPNLYFDVARPGDKLACLRGLLAQREGQTGIVYCATRANVERVCERLRESGIPATRYHAGLEDDERRQNQEDFIYDRSRVMVATNAFGMGIDKSNVSFVIHYNMPKSLESYYQEAGRAGRDGAPADCVLLYADADVVTARLMIQHSDDNQELSGEERELARLRDLERLERMVGYCKTSGCLRAYILRYFGEAEPPPCGHCGNCGAEYADVDIITEAQKALSCVRRIENKFRGSLGMSLVAQTLCGGRGQRITQLGLDALPTYGAMRDAGQRRTRDVLDALLEQGFLLASGGEYPVVRTTALADEVLFHGKAVTLRLRRDAQATDKPASARGKARQGAPTADEPETEALYETLKALRSMLAREAGLPAYLIFTNAALLDMARKQPDSREAFLRVSGVGEAKAARYGAAFLRAICEYREGKA